MSIDIGDNWFENVDGSETQLDWVVGSPRGTAMSPFYSKTTPLLWVDTKGFKMGVSLSK